MKFSKYIIKAVTIVMALFQKQHRLFFKQSYDTLRLSRCESAASAGTAQSERCLHRNQRAVSTSHNVPSDNHRLVYTLDWYSDFPQIHSHNYNTFLIHPKTLYI